MKPREVAIFLQFWNILTLILYLKEASGDLKEKLTLNFIVKAKWKVYVKKQVE